MRNWFKNCHHYGWCTSVLRFLLKDLGPKCGDGIYSQCVRTITKCSLTAAPLSTSLLNPSHSTKGTSYFCFIPLADFPYLK